MRVQYYYITAAVGFFYYGNISSLADLVKSFLDTPMTPVLNIPLHMLSPI